ncbi:MAG: hypothetical protein ACP5JY_01470 [Candidatus Nanoarchaeia archaeon]
MTEAPEALKKPIDIIHKLEAEDKKITAQDVLDKDVNELIKKRETHKLLSQLKVILAIALGHQKNKDLAKVLDTDKSFAAKQIKELEAQGLIKKEGSGKHTTYQINNLNVLNFLQTKVVIKWSKKDTNKGGNENGEQRDGK